MGSSFNTFFNLSNMVKFPFFIVLCAGLFSCSQPVKDNVGSVSHGLWRGVLDIGSGEEIPFHFELSGSENDYVCTFINGKEEIVSDDIAFFGDSMVINMPVFNSGFFLSLIDSENLSGYWQNFSRTPEYKLPFVAKHNSKDRFIKPENPIMDPLGERKWEVSFVTGDGEASPAIGLFDYEKSGRVCGTFATETGDFRYLEGLYCDSTLKLSCFDGSHAFLFRAKKQNNGSLSGTFWSGKHWQESWIATENPDYSLSNPYSLTSLSVPENEIAFSFPDLSGNKVSLSDERFKGKAIVLQILGSWCPNCVDESRLFQETYAKHKKDGLEIIGLCFEASKDFDVASKRVEKFQNNLGIEYPLLIAGVASKSKATETLGFLDQIRSFPTSVFIDKEGRVQQIHTGFYGPGTGDYYDEHVKEFNALISQIIR